MSKRFSKLDAQGRTMAADATDFVAIYDATTGLAWSRHHLADADGDNEMDHASATTACSELELCGAKVWRLPTVEELFALADRSRCRPTIDTEFFPECASDWYWSSTPWADSPESNAWFVDFGLGLAYHYSRGSYAFVRAVRSVSPAASQ